MMKSTPNIAEAAALIGDPARANMLAELMDGRARTATELSAVAGVGAPTTSAHLAKLVAGGLLALERQGRHRYYRLANAQVAQIIEALEAHAAGGASGRLRRPGPKDAGLRRLRRCYDHLAGEIAVAVVDSCIERGWLIEGEAEFGVTETGESAFGALGLDLAAARRKRRGFSNRCLDWSERRAHLGGALGAALMSRFTEIGWVARDPSSRAMILSTEGERALQAQFGVVATQAA